MSKEDIKKALDSLDGKDTTTKDDDKSTFTKRKVNLILNFCILGITMSYVLAFLDKVQIAESLSSTMATVIIGTMAPYMCKAFFETREQKANALKKASMLAELEDMSDSVEQETVDEEDDTVDTHTPLDEESEDIYMEESYNR